MSVPDLPFVIGGHDAAAILGVNQFKTPLQVWGEKLGLITAEDISDKPVIQRGHEMESHLIDLYGAVTGRDCMTPTTGELRYTVNGKAPEIPRVHHPDYPWAVAAVDSRALREHHGRTQLGALDAKTTSIWIREKWGDPVDHEVQSFTRWPEPDTEDAKRLAEFGGKPERRQGRRVYPTASAIPLEMNIQQQHYMWVENLPFASFAIGIIDDRAYRKPIKTANGNHAMFGLTDFLWCDVERNEGFIESMVKTVKNFVHCLETRERPDELATYRDKATLAKLIGPEERGNEIALDGEAYQLVLKSHLIRNNIKVQEKELDRINVDLQERMQNAETGMLPNGNLVTFRTQAEKEIHSSSYTRKAKRILRVPQARHMKPMPVADSDTFVIK